MTIGTDSPEHAHPPRSRGRLHVLDAVLVGWLAGAGVMLTLLALWAAKPIS